MRNEMHTKPSSPNKNTQDLRSCKVENQRCKYVACRVDSPELPINIRLTSFVGPLEHRRQRHGYAVP